MQFVDVEDRDLAEIESRGILVEEVEARANELHCFVREARVACVDMGVDAVFPDSLSGPRRSDKGLIIGAGVTSDHHPVDRSRGEGARGVYDDGIRNVVPQIPPNVAREVELERSLREVGICEPKDPEFPGILAGAVALPGWNRHGRSG